MNKSALFHAKERAGISPLDWLFVGGDFFILVSVFLVWRQTRIAHQPDVLITAWQLGFLGGQGLFSLALLLLLLFALGILFFRQLQQRFVNVVYAFILLVSFVLLTKQVLSSYPSNQIILRSTLGMGFYVAIVGCNLLVFYCIFRFMLRKAHVAVSSS